MKKLFFIALYLFLLVGLVGCRQPETGKHNHDFSSEIIDPTCSQEGYTMYTCQTCGFKMKGDFVPALQNGGHSYYNYVCEECCDFLISEAVDTVTLNYTKATDKDSNEFYIVTGATAESAYIKIPSIHDGIPVTQIADEAFYNLLALKHVVIPDSVISIGKAAFKYCTELISVAMSDRIVSIGEEAFWDCQNLKSISLPNLTMISNYALIGCESLTNIGIPEGVTEIGIHALSDCYNLMSITIPVSVTKIQHAALWRCRSLQNIYYSGTKEQWYAIVKEEGKYSNTNEDASWNAYTGTYTVHCFDGDIEK